MHPGNGEGQGCGAQRAVSRKERLEGGGPQQNGHGEVNKGAPRLDDFTGGVLAALLGLDLFEGGSGGLAVNVPGLPLAHDQGQYH